MHDLADSPNNGGGLVSRLRRKIRSFISNDAEEAWEALRTEHQNGDDDALTDEERKLIQAALRLDSVTVDEISVPRSEIIAVNVKANFKEVLAVFQESRRSRLPVMGENLDDILGMVSLKEIVANIGKESKFTLANVLRPAIFLPEMMTLDRALQKLKQDHIQVAIVVDEYGGTAGLVTLKDMLEELVGDIEDDVEDNDPIAPIPLNDNTYKLDPRWLMADLRTQFDLPEPMDDDDLFETVGGYVLQLVGRIPAKGDEATGINGLIFRVTEATPRQIEALEVTLPIAKSQDASPA